MITNANGVYVAVVGPNNVTLAGDMTTVTGSNGEEVKAPVIYVVDVSPDKEGRSILEMEPDEAQGFIEERVSEGRCFGLCYPTKQDFQSFLHFAASVVGRMEKDGALPDEWYSSDESDGNDEGDGKVVLFGPQGKA